MMFPFVSLFVCLIVCLVVYLCLCYQASCGEVESIWREATLLVLVDCLFVCLFEDHAACAHAAWNLAEIESLWREAPWRVGASQCEERGGALHNVNTHHYHV